MDFMNCRFCFTCDTQSVDKGHGCRGFFLLIKREMGESIGLNYTWENIISAKS